MPAMRTVLPFESSIVSPSNTRVTRIRGAGLGITWLPGQSFCAARCTSKASRGVALTYAFIVITTLAVEGLVEQSCVPIARMDRSPTPWSSSSLDG